MVESFVPSPMLIVDDSEIDRIQLSRYLSLSGIQLEMRETCEDALTLLSATESYYECIFLDYRLPDGDGLDLLKRIRNTIGCSSPIIIMTSYEDEELAIQCLKEGAQDYLLKSELNREHLFRAIRFAYERTELEKKLMTAIEEAEHANRVKTQFLSVISHELRTPLNGILGISQLLAKNKEKNLSEKQLDAIKSVNNNGRQLLALVDDLLDITKIEANRISVEVGFIELDQLMKGVDELFAPIAAAKSIQLELINLCEKGTVLESDLHRLKQILRNFIGNAIKFTYAGTVSLQIEMGEMAEPIEGVDRRTVRFVVSDTGIGIPHEKFETIFNLFEQVDGSITRSYGGNGLGLAICKNLSELLGGYISVISEVDRGSEFILELPLLWNTKNCIRSPDTVYYKEDFKQEFLSSLVDTSHKTVHVWDNDIKQLFRTNQLIKRFNFDTHIFDCSSDDNYNPAQVVDADILVIGADIEEQKRILPLLAPLGGLAKEEQCLVIAASDWKQALTSMPQFNLKRSVFLEKRSFFVELENTLVDMLIATEAVVSGG